MQTTTGTHHHRSSRFTDGEVVPPRLRIELPENVPTIPERMREAGYFTFNSGKDDYNFHYDRRKLYSTGTGDDYKPGMNGWQGNRSRVNGSITENTWNARPDKKQPWFGQIQIKGGKGSDRLVAKADLIPAESLTPPAYFPDTKVYRTAWTKHYNSVRGSDLNVGQILDQLRADGELENTIVFFFSDHGNNESPRHKQFCYEGGVHVPLIIHGSHPAIVAGKVRNDLVSGLDISATTLRLAGVELSEMIDGQDLFAKDFSPRDHVISARDRCDYTIDRIRTVRTDRFRYIRNGFLDRSMMQAQYRDKKPIMKEMKTLNAAGKLTDYQREHWFGRRPPEELYEIESDPDQMNNLAADPKFAETLLGHRKVLDDWIAKTGDKGQATESSAQLKATYDLWESRKIFSEADVNPEYDAFKKPAESKSDKAASPQDDSDNQSSKFSLEPGTTQFVEFPSLGKTWQDVPTRAGLYLPKDYTPDRKFPLLVTFGGGAGTDKPGRAASITNGRGFICVGVPYRPESDEQKGGWQTEWSYYKTIFDKIESLVPNIDPERRACTGYSSGGAAILNQIGNSDGEFQKYFHAFMPTAAGWPMGELDTIKGRPMLAIMGEDDKRLPNYRKLEEAAKEAGVKFKLRVLKGSGHKIPSEQFPAMREWLVSSLNISQRKEDLPAEQRDDFDWADIDEDGALSPTELKSYQNFYRRTLLGRESLPAKTRIVEDLAYVTDGHVRQKLDIYLPPDAADSEAPLPLVVWVHGGGWQKGTKELLQGQQVLLDHGFAFASVNYRLIPHAPFPAQIHDCKAAIRYLRANASTYNIDPDHIGVWGSSAGGHLVALLGTSGGVVELEGDIGTTKVSSRVQAVCDYFGPTNLFTQAKRKKPTGRFARDSASDTIGRLLGGTMESKHHLCELASPYHHVDKGDPPFLMMHGDADPLVPLDQSTSFRDLLVKAGVECELRIVPGGGHAFCKTEEQLKQVVEFFKQQLK